MKIRHFWAAAVALGTLSTSASSADFSDPTWPCVQRKVESLSLGLMWPHVIEPDGPALSPALAGDIRELADFLALRRIELEDLRDDVAAFAAKHDADARSLGLVFQNVFDRLSNRRTQIIEGIEDFSLGQIALAEQVDANRVAFDTALAADPPDYDLIDTLEEQIDWDQVIYSDRQRSIIYLCETPQLLEKRIFAVAQLLSQHIEE